MLSFCCLTLKAPSLNSSTSLTSFISSCSSSNCWRSKNRRRRCLNSKPHLLHVSAAVSLYQKFIDFALCKTKRLAVLEPSPVQESFNTIIAMDGKTELQMLSYQAPKIRLLRSMDIQNEVMQILDFAVFPKPEFDVPIFCANFFTSASRNIVVLDLNPLHDVIYSRDYKDKYYKSLMSLGLKYSQLLPWGGKLTSESIKFFSPIVVWTKFTSSQDKHDILYSAFMEYYKTWLELIDQAIEETNISQIVSNCKAQHKYLTWRAEKDPGHGLLKKLIGDMRAKDLLRNFLFNGVDELGSKRFLDYFPEYCCEDGSVSEKRSIIGKSFENRPWDSRGEFVGNNF